MQTKFDEIKNFVLILKSLSNGVCHHLYDEIIKELEMMNDIRSMTSNVSECDYDVLGFDVYTLVQHGEGEWVNGEFIKSSKNS